MGVAMTAPLDQQAMRERHTRVRDRKRFFDDLERCNEDGQQWPCEARRWKGDFTEACRQRDALEVELEKVRLERDVAFKVLARLGLVRHAGTWITREEAERISKDGP